MNYHQFAFYWDFNLPPCVFVKHTQNAFKILEQTRCKLEEECRFEFLVR